MEHRVEAERKKERERLKCLKTIIKVNLIRSR